ncbi:hypothetical protein ZIOFF_017044 [Zingiber officinale]|uniref:Uncharacterized protein n=1 Tax=Zingiber officinale TaxID=94328 RepID=A0A8J5HB54_ZINOF|nr:hypothetical protein ZIOFF_017044 [Zingiber officinale]
MGGVIDSDYRGEVKIMAFNTTNNDIFLNKQECIAQLIIERIATPNVREVEVLNSTPRGVLGFGSTTTRYGCSHIKADPECTECHYCCSDEEYAAEYSEYVAAPEGLPAGQNLKEKEVMKIKPFPHDKLLAMQKKARQVGRSKIFSKFDLKSGFHQVAMDPESVPWTAFWVPDDLFEWLVMPFSLKNAPAVFQRKMDNCFKVLLKICQQNGLILNPTKMKIGSPTIEFLGASIGHSKIKLQPHIISKVADFSNQDLQTTKGLRSWLGILNYARSYIPNLGKILGPLYSKTSPKGEKRINTQDWALVDKVKAMVKTLPDLAIPPTSCFIIIESDGCPWNPSDEDMAIMTHFKEALEQLESRPHIQTSQHLAGLIHYWTNMKNSLKESGQVPIRHMKKTKDSTWRTSKAPQQGIYSIACGNSSLSSMQKKKILPDAAKSKEDSTSTFKTLCQK